MEVIKTSGFSELTCADMQEIEGGLFGVAWFTWALLGKIFAGAVTLGAAGATAYLATK